MPASSQRYDKLPSITASRRIVPPQSALQEQILFDTLNKAAKEFVKRYTRPAGTLIWFDH
ncbi:hypothetical protein [Paenibacillus roseipurpureus]|uniref:Uncharacterized protein n=1 Tax=Paenibacillus roseopurpureus TaxID=2918901 RepID=A0AA96LKP3_9BACL|nr:hypothetical protein [Paenibacillus sp. MBLB1832]WNR42719.1 hypothetical protein MJB10_16515 [Paenibacillus sp. MBLB1832]